MGSRNETLNRAAFNLGQLVGVGTLDRDAVESLLLEAALESGLGEEEARGTIRSGIEAGIRTPRSLRVRPGSGESEV
jgi:hypothetical protein